MSLNAAFEAVYMINGAFYEGGTIKYCDNTVVYITVLPLDALLLPYTVKLLGARVTSNRALCRAYRLGQNEYCLKFKKRYNFVYSPQNDETPEPPSSTVEKFFRLIKEDKTAEARALMSRELSDSIDNASLKAFFDGYEDITEDKRRSDSFYLIDDKDCGFRYRFAVKNGLIDDIVEFKE